MGYSTAQFVSNWERGLSLPSHHCMKKLSQIYRMDWQDLGKIVYKMKMKKTKARLEGLYAKT
jgi:hypothetical protein